MNQHIGLLLLEIYKASATPIIAAVAGLIAYRQWHTARQKLILDLFDKRFDVYQNITSACSRFLQSGVVDVETERMLAEGVRRTRFLFGREIEKEIDLFWKEMLWMRNYERRYEVSSSDSQIRMDERRARFSAKAEAILEGKIFLPYLKMDVRL